MKIEVQGVGEEAVLMVEGPTVYGPVVNQYEDRIRRLINDGAKRVVIDLSNIKWFDSAFLNALTKALCAVREGGGNLNVVGVNEKIRKIFRTTHLDTLFKEMDSVDSPCTGTPTRALALE